MGKKVYTAVGLMSGTSMDGVDASIIKSDGKGQFLSILDQYFEYDDKLYEKIVKLRNKISIKEDLKKYFNELNLIEREITIFNATVVNKILKKIEINVDLVGFHGQTIFHEPSKKTTKQLGNAKLLSQLIKKKVIYDFRKNDLKNGGQGAPLTPIFHILLADQIHKKFKVKFPIYILNIGGISNITRIRIFKDELLNATDAYDIAPGNCLIDEWIRKNSNERFDKGGKIAKSGTTNKLILNQALENFRIEDYKKSLDIKDFDISFIKGLSLEDGSSTLTDFTSTLIAKGIDYIHDEDNNKNITCLIAGGGRKNDFLISKIKNNLKNKKLFLNPIDKYEINGDFVESQAFAYLAIRSYLNLPISFPETTGVKKATVGGVIVKNY